jgi:predicted lipoprotein with Yx(FWY)xxD motif
MASRMTAKFGAGGVAALVVSALILAGCGSASSTSTSTAAAAAAPAASSASSTTSATSDASAGAQMISITKGPHGSYLTGTDGRAIYLWVADSGGKSACSGACAKAWPPVETKGNPTAGAGVTASKLGTTTRSDGSEQVTYNGHPLYYFIADKSAGDVTGQGNDSFGAKWWLVAPSGDAITTGGASGGASSSGGSTTSSS